MSRDVTSYLVLSCMRAACSRYWPHSLRCRSFWLEFGCWSSSFFNCCSLNTSQVKLVKLDVHTTIAIVKYSLKTNRVWQFQPTGLWNTMSCSYIAFSKNWQKHSTCKCTWRAKQDMPITFSPDQIVKTVSRKALQLLSREQKSLSRCCASVLLFGLL